MRVLLLSPWFRTLANIWASELRRLGHDVVVVTTPNHFEPLPAHADEIVLAHRPRSASGMREYPGLRRAVRRFDADIVLMEQFRDPRLMGLVKAGTPHVLMVHDAVPHDATHKVPWQRRSVMALLERRLTGVVTFSETVAATIRATYPGWSVAVVPLPSEMPDELVPSLVHAHERHDFFCIGRIRPYKNLAVVFAAWDQHVESAAYRGDTLHIIGAGDLGTSLPAHSQHADRRFAFADVAPQLAAGKASIAMYRTGSQSGAQLFSMQVGCPAIVSTVGGLAEHQLPELPPIDPDDLPGLNAALARLADPVAAAALGAASREAYRVGCSAAVSAQRLADVLERRLASRRRPS